MRLFEAVKTIIFFLYFFIQMVEEPGHGDEKKTKVLGYMQEALELLGERFGLPNWLIALLKREEFLGFLIDMIVRFFNQVGFFQKGQNSLPAQT
ncbi:MAG: hypothetical protein GX354_10280 [Firmicutes bacterium]|nr:hypothetical protein [Bacillota bacterium]